MKILRLQKGFSKTGGTPLIYHLSVLTYVLSSLTGSLSTTVDPIVRSTLTFTQVLD